MNINTLSTLMMITMTMQCGAQQYTNEIDDEEEDNLVEDRDN